MQIAKKLVYNSVKNCFLYLYPQDFKHLNLNDNDVIEIISNEKKLYFSIFFINSQTKSNDSQSLFLNGLYAKKLNLIEKNLINLNQIHHECPIATSVTLKPLSLDDWQILELNLESIENTILDQIKVFFRDQIFPIWIDSDLCIYVKTINFDPPTRHFTSINTMTRIIVEPYIDQEKVENCLDTIQKSVESWDDIFQVEFSQDFQTNCSGILNQCSNLTKCELNGNSKSSIDTIVDKYLVSLQPIKSPIQLLKSKESSTVSIKKFLSTVESSYPANYQTIYESNKVAYALLDTINFMPDCSAAQENKPKIILSNFLKEQLGLFELNPKVMVKAQSVLNEKSKTILSSTNVKSIKLKTNYSSDIQHVKSAFINFIDQNSECLCPIILTNGTILDLVYKNEIIKCQLSLNDELIAINSNTLLNNFFKLTIENTKELADKQDITKIKKFNLSIIEPEWFRKNQTNILTYLNQTFLSTNPKIKPRNLVIQGLNGSGKTMLCKSLCNLVSNTIYFYINCQNFISKTADTIYDQLKLIYQECIWYETTPCLVILENIDLLIENKSHTTDPSSLLYYSQIVEVIKEVMLMVWESRNNKIVTIVTTSTPISELPDLFHSLDEHGLFAEFYQILPHVDKNETKEIIKLLTKAKKIVFSDELIDNLINHCDGFVFKDIEKLIDKISYSNFSNRSENRIEFSQEIEKILYNYTSINMIETKFYKSRADLGWSLIGGLDEIKSNLIETLIWPIKYKSLYSKFMMKQSSGVLLYGPSGCGKTLIASALANESKFNFLSVKGPEILSKYIGNSEQNVRDLFRKAQKSKPCIIFFDEFDSLAPKRGHDSTGVTDRVVNQLLTQLDGIEQLDGVYLLAATSRPDLIDQALLRPGRLDSYFFIDYPSKHELEKIFEIYCKNVKLCKEVDFKILSENCEFFTGADVKSAICDALIKAFHRAHKTHSENENLDLMDSIVLEQSDIVSSLDSIKQTINVNERKKLRKIYENWKNKKSDNEKPQKARVTLA